MVPVNLCMRMYSLRRSGPFPLSLVLWWLIIIPITHWIWNKLNLGWWRSRMQSLMRIISGPRSFSINSMMELETILVVGQENLEAHEVQEVREVEYLVNQRKLQDHQGKYKLAEKVFGLISSIVLKCDQLGLTSRIFLPEHNQCPDTWVTCTTRVNTATTNWNAIESKCHHFRHVKHDFTNECTIASSGIDFRLSETHHNTLYGDGTVFNEKTPSSSVPMTENTI